jgi:hypothetical protein
MKTIVRLGILPLLFFAACQQNNSQSQTSDSLQINEFSYLLPEGNNVETRFPTPPGFTRITAEKGTFAAYLRALTLKVDKSPVKLYNGSFKYNQSAHIAVIDMEIGKSDLQQCADAVMRLRAEYLFHAGKSEKISFNYSNGLG